MIRIDSIKKLNKIYTKEDVIIDSKFISEYDNKNIKGIYINNISDLEEISTALAFVKCKKIKKVIFKINIKDEIYMQKLYKIINCLDNYESLELEINIDEVDNQDIDKIKRYMDSFKISLNIGIYLKFNRDKKQEIIDYIYEVMGNYYIKTIDISESNCKKEIVEESKTIHFNGDIVCTDNESIINKNIQRDKTFNSLIESNLDNLGNKELFTFIDPDKPLYEISYTYKEFDIEVNKACKALINAGIKKGSHVALWMNSTKEWFIYFFAATKIGAIVIPLSKAFRQNDIEYALYKYDIEMLIMSNGYEENNYIEIISDLGLKYKKAPFLRKIITIDFKADGCIENKDFINSGKNVSDETCKKMSLEVYNDDIGIILPTSGTTGFPKGVMLSHERIIHNGKYIGDGMELNSNDIMGIIVSMFHCFGITLSMMASMTHNCKMVIPTRFIGESTVSMINKYKISCLNGAPAHFQEILKAYENYGSEIKLRTGIMAGCNCPSELMKQIADTFEMKPISVYGQTELSPGDTMSNINDLEEIRYNTVGKKFDYVDIKLIDDDGNEVSDGIMGEIIVKSPDVMLGYYKDPKSTREIIDKNGYLHSGDLAIRQDGIYKIVDRKKNMIIVKGENVQPMEVESEICKIQGVSEARVYGIDINSSKEQVVIADVVVNDSSLTGSIIIDYLKKVVARYKVPYDIRIVPELYFNANGKPDVIRHKNEYINSLDNNLVLKKRFKHLYN